MEPLEESGEELIDDQGRNVTQQRMDQENGLDSPGEPAATERDEGWFDGADPESPSSRLNRGQTSAGNAGTIGHARFGRAWSA